MIKDVRLSVETDNMIQEKNVMMQIQLTGTVVQINVELNLIGIVTILGQINASLYVETHLKSMVLKNVMMEILLKTMVALLLALKNMDLIVLDQNA